MSLVPMSRRVVPKPRSSDIEDSTMKDQLSKAWKRIADLETRIHDLTLQATMVRTMLFLYAKATSSMCKMTHFM